MFLGALCALFGRPMQPPLLENAGWTVSFAKRCSAADKRSGQSLVNQGSTLKERSVRQLDIEMIGLDGPVSVLPGGGAASGRSGGKLTALFIDHLSASVWSCRWSGTIRSMSAADGFCVCC